MRITGLTFLFLIISNYLFATDTILLNVVPRDSIVLAKLLTIAGTPHTQNTPNILIKYEDLSIFKQRELFEKHECSTGDTFQAMFKIKKCGKSTFIALVNECECSKNFEFFVSEMVDNHTEWQPATVNGELVDSVIIVTFHILIKIQSI